MAQATNIINALGGTSAVAKSLKLRPSTVSSWKTSGKIPEWRMEAVERVAADKGINLSSFAESAPA